MRKNRQKEIKWELAFSVAFLRIVSRLILRAMEELTKRVGELEKRVQHLDAMLRFQQEKTNEFL